MPDTTEREQRIEAIRFGVALVVVILAVNLLFRDAWTPRLIGGTLLMLLIVTSQTDEARRDAANIASAVVSVVVGFIVSAGALLVGLYLFVRFVKWAWIG